METSERERYDHLVATWQASAADVIALLTSLPAAQWATPTELPGWDVNAVAAHVAHFESAWVGLPQQEVAVPAAPHLTAPTSQATEAGVIARRDWAPEQIIEELTHAVAVRARQLADHPPASLTDPGDGFARFMGWTWETMLSNRVIDLWMHEQDIRRPVGRHGGLTTAGAELTRDALTAALPMVVAKRAKAPVGSTVLFEATGDGGLTLAVRVGEDGRARLFGSDRSGEPTVTLTMSFEEWVRRSGGRGADPAAVRIRGDHTLAEAVLAGLTITP